MGAIKIGNYQQIAQNYANAQKQVSGISDYYFQSAYEIVLLQVFDPELDLLQPFYNAYLASQTIYLQAPSAVINAVKRIQQHVLDKARTDANEDSTGTEQTFSDINDWIDAKSTNGSPGATSVGRKDDFDDSFKVAQEFANLSSQAGFVIETENIDNLL